MMIESSIRFLSRMKLIYTCIYKLVTYLKKNTTEKVLESLEHYADSNFYHHRNDDMKAILKTLMNDSDILLKICGDDYLDVTEYQLFISSLSDQTVIEDYELKKTAQ